MPNLGPAATLMDLSRLYENRFCAAEVRHKEKLWAVLVETTLQPYIAPSDVVLDLGGGQSEFLQAVRCDRKLLVDLHPRGRDSAAFGIESIRASVDDLSALADASVDVAFASNLFEHLRSTEQLLATLREVRRTLRPGGRLLVLQPNIRFAYREYWDFLDHHLPLSDRSLTEALCLERFDVERCLPQFLPFSTKSRWPQPAWALRLYVRLPLMWQWAGKQMFLVARKPA